MIEIKTHSEKPIHAKQLRRIYDEVNWWPERTPKDIGRMLDQNSELVYGLWDGSDLAAFCRLVSDGVFRAYVEDFVVAESHRSKGLGTHLLRDVLKRNAGIDVISLFSDESLGDYYRGLGFRCYQKQQVFHYYTGQPQASSTD